MRTLIASWIVLDDTDTASAFPSVAGNSASTAFQLIYWRCLVIYFLTARVHNPTAPLLLYANVDLETAAPPEILAALRKLDVTFRQLAITSRLPRGTVKSFGNQFYVLDVIRDFASRGDADALVLTDSDCVWRCGLGELEAKLRAHKCLLYTLAPADQKDYEVGNLINGMTHARMSQIARDAFGLPSDHQVQYHGGEFFAATLDFCRDMQAAVDRLWKLAYAEAALPDSIKEEAHFLSILSEGLGVAPGTANAFVRRIWTHFSGVNTVSTDRNLTIWHVPAEKQFGFRRLWRDLQRSGRNWQSFTPEEINEMTSRYLGVPQRTLPKLVLDLTEKVMARISRAS